MASREELLLSIRPDMKLNKAFFLKVYGYEITWPGFAEKALSALEMIAGCSRAREHYQKIVNDYEEAYQKEMKEVGEWYVQQCERKRRERGEEIRRREKENLRQMSDSNLIALLKSLTDEA
ncbi:MAG: hypothetical protein HFI38_03295 [Lachnospiraceae bacterium]|jgi:hypothetical protein|nr:hypothetical protein [Lachnospiraceae bacterium]